MSQKNYWYALALALFLGVFGAHRFYVGRIGSGFAYLITLGLFGFGWLWDIGALLIGGFRDSNGLKLKANAGQINRSASLFASIPPGQNSVSQAFNEAAQESEKLNPKLETDRLEYIDGEVSYAHFRPFIVVERLEYVALDFETTGLQPNSGDRVIQAGLVVLDDVGRVRRDFSTFVNPGMPVLNSHIHGIRDEDLRRAPKFEQVWGDIERTLEDRVLVAHQAGFEIGFLKHELSRFDATPNHLKFASIDTLVLSKKLIKGLENYRLSTIQAHLGIDTAALPGRGLHDALTDAHLAARLLSNFIEMAPETVRDSVSWPLVGSHRTSPKLVLPSEAELLRSELGEAREFLDQLGRGPASPVALEPLKEVYFSGFGDTDENFIEDFCKKLRITRAKSVTKSRCGLVVAKDNSYFSGSLKRAKNWHIPVITAQHMDAISVQN